GGVGGAHCALAIRLMRYMARTATMPELPKDDAAMIMHFARDMAPGFDLRAGVQAGLEGPGTRPFADGNAAGDDQARTGALRKIAGCAVFRRPVRVAGARALHGRHDKAVLEAERPQIVRIEQGRHRDTHSKSFRMGSL